MDFSGLILDVHDDVTGATIKNLYPSWESIPGIIKQAHSITAEERERLPNEAFALVMRNDGEEIRKYACIDAGNTILSVQYFLKHAHKLPENAQKVAAANLVAACGWYDIQPPEILEKISGVGDQAMGLAGTAMSVAQLPSQIMGTGAAIQHGFHKARGAENLAAQAGANTSQQIAHGLHAVGRVKTAEVVGTEDMPITPPVRPIEQKVVIKKTAEHPLASARASGNQVPAEMLGAVDVTHEKVASRQVMQKVGRRFALPEKRMYPLDSYAHVKMASAYIDKNWDDLVPEVRREYCVNLVKRASELDIPVSDQVRDYGNTLPASLDSIDLGLIMRKEAASEDLHEFIYKLAEMKSEITPARLCDLLFDFDKLAGIQDRYGSSIPDPYETVFVEKYASKPFSDEIDGKTITESDLKSVASSGKAAIIKALGEDFYSEFKDDPVAIYSSMPRAEKKLIISCAGK